MERILMGGMAFPSCAMAVTVAGDVSQSVID